MRKLSCQLHHKALKRSNNSDHLPPHWCSGELEITPGIALGSGAAQNWSHTRRGVGQVGNRRILYVLEFRTLVYIEMNMFVIERLKCISRRSMNCIAND